VEGGEGEPEKVVSVTVVVVVVVTVFLTLVGEELETILVVSHAISSLKIESPSTS
jgi:hypothetical protein